MATELQCEIGEPVYINHELLDRVSKDAATKHNRVLAVVTATKPCFYKLWGIMQEAAAQDLPFFILHSGQHYDDTVGHGFKEFNFSEHLGVDLRVRGDLCHKSAEFYLKVKMLAKYFKEHWPNILMVPYTNGDTVTVAHFGCAWLFATNRSCIQGEAALRSMSPEGFEQLSAEATPEEIIGKQWGGAPWVINRTEPFPEQFDTFVGAASCEYFFAPLQLNADHLIREGYAKENIFIVGNTVVDAIKAKQLEKPSTSVFDVYPKLQKGSWLRVDFHRRENLNKRRFAAIIGCIVELVESGYSVAFIELTAARTALEKYGLREKLLALSNRDNFLFTPVWKEYAHVIEFLQSDRCWAILTDSGSMQEEMNELGKPCLTARFSTDRPETVFAESNLLVPPLDARQMSSIIRYVHDSPSLLQKMSEAEKLYGRDVSKNIVSQVAKLFARNDAFFSWAHDRLNIYHEDEFLEYL